MVHDRGYLVLFCGSKLDYSTRLNCQKGQKRSWVTCKGKLVDFALIFVHLLEVMDVSKAALLTQTRCSHGPEPEFRG